MKEVDVVVIGGGVTGTAILSYLSRYNLRCMLVEKAPDIAMGTTKANSAILHAGFDAPTGSNKARLNVEGNALYHELEEELDLDIKWTGSYVVAKTAEEAAVLETLKARGEANGVAGLEIVSGDKLREAEPNVTKEIKAALFAPTAGICWPFDIAAAFAENAVENGAEIVRDCEVIKITPQADGGFLVRTMQGELKAKTVVNAAGVYADKVSALAGDDSFTIRPRKGEYILFDKTAQQSLVKGIIFPVPSATSKGILVCGTTHGNVFIGPNANDTDSKDDLSVSAPGMNEIIAGAKHIVDNLPMGAAITQFAGLRAVSSTGDFIIGRSEKVKGLYQAAGIQSPGLTSAPAIGKEIAAQVAEDLGAKAKAEYKKGRPSRPVVRDMTMEEQKKLIQEDKRYGLIVCRCETITEGEICDAIHRPCGARTVDGVKRRTRAGMGRCQGGFCGPRVALILARELHLPVTEIRKDGEGSFLYYDKEQEVY